MKDPFYTMFTGTVNHSLCNSAEKNKVLSKSSVDHLFNSPEIQSIWWSIWGTSGFKLKEITVRKEGELEAYATLYVDQVTPVKLLKTRRMQFVGTNYQNIVVPRIEYLDIVCSMPDPRLAKLVLESTLKVKWHDFVLRDILKDSETTKNILDFAKNNNLTVRSIHEDRAYSVDCRYSFDEYLKTRGKNTRLKLYNRRTLLAKLGSVSIENFFPCKVDEFFDLMSQFHKSRWGDTFSTNTLSLHKQLISSLCEKGGKVTLSVLSVDGVYQSVLYDIELAGKIYNIQSAYNQHFHKKISLGLLHLGYAIEAAHSNEAVNCYDFLAGGGKNSLYKEHLSTHTSKLHSLQLIRAKRLKTLYCVKDTIEALKKLIGYKA